MNTNPSLLRLSSVLFAGIMAVCTADIASAQRINPATGLPASDFSSADPIDLGVRQPAHKPGELSPEAVAMNAALATAKEVRGLIAGGQYDEALQRCLSFQHQLKGDQTVTPLLADWVELGRRFPKAREALLEIRNHDAGEFSQGRGYAVLFSEISAINSSLNEDDATYALFKSLGQQDKKLAQECYGNIAPLLIQRGEFDLCLSYIGEPQAQFDSFRDFFTRQRDSQKRMAEMNQRTAQQLKEINQKHGLTNTWTPPDTAAMMKQYTENSFVGQTRQLIEILVGAGRKAEAEKIRDQAVALLDDPRLQSAVSDAAEKIHGKPGQNGGGNK